jgi:cytochrome c oxidase cbb3-type subunit 3
MRTQWILAGFFLLGVITVMAQDEDVSNPYTSAEDLAAGAEVFKNHCASCHGGDGSGGKGPDLTRAQFRYGSSDAALYRTIRSGISKSGMPRLGAPDSRVWRVLAHVRSLSQSAREQDVPGDPERGRELFSGRGDCSRCHMVDGHGGRVGPDLSEIAWMRSTRHLRTSILDPNQEVDRGYRSIEAVQKNGQVIRGVPLNEDPYSIQLMDLEEDLHSLIKSDLEELRQEDRSWMPAYQGVFSGSELDDLVAYLYSLRRKTDSP